MKPKNRREVPVENVIPNVSTQAYQLPAIVTLMDINACSKVVYAAMLSEADETGMLMLNTEFTAIAAGVTRQIIYKSLGRMEEVGLIFIKSIPDPGYIRSRREIYLRFKANSTEFDPPKGIKWKNKIRVNSSISWIPG